MTGILEIISMLEDKHLNYVVERSKTTNDKDAFNAAGIPKSTYYAWEQETRDHLNDLAQQLKRDTAVKMIMVFQENAVQSAENIVSLANKARSESVKLNANNLVIERVGGKVSQPIDNKNSGETTIRIIRGDDATDD